MDATIFTVASIYNMQCYQSLIFDMIMQNSA